MTEKFRDLEVPALRELLATTEKDRDLAKERVAALEAGLRREIARCPGCSGRGYIVMGDGHGDIDKDPCVVCWDVRELLQDQTDYVLKATEAAAAQPPADLDCQKNPLCMREDGHDGECDDIPF